MRRGLNVCYWWLVCNRLTETWGWWSWICRLIRNRLSKSWWSLMLLWGNMVNLLSSILIRKALSWSGLICLLKVCSLSLLMRNMLLCNCLICFFLWYNCSISIFCRLFPLLIYIFIFGCSILSCLSLRMYWSILNGLIILSRLLNCKNLIRLCMSLLICLILHIVCTWRWNQILLIIGWWLLILQLRRNLAWWREIQILGFLVRNILMLRLLGLSGLKSCITIYRLRLELTVSLLGRGDRYFEFRWMRKNLGLRIIRQCFLLT